MRLKCLRIDRKEWGKDEGKLFGTITFESQDAVVTTKLTEYQAYRLLGIVADSVVESAHETAKILVSDIQQPLAEIEGEVA